MVFSFFGVAYPACYGLQVSFDIFLLFGFGQYGFLRTNFKRCALVEVGGQRQGGIGGGGGDFDAVGGVGGFRGDERTNGEGRGETGEGEMVGLTGSHGVEFKDDNEVCMVT
jgi:hypothetical protein